jgi:hypothetical protein
MEHWTERKWLRIHPFPGLFSNQPSLNQRIIRPDKKAGWVHLERPASQNDLKGNRRGFAIGVKQFSQGEQGMASLLS